MLTYPKYLVYYHQQDAQGGLRNKGRNRMNAEQIMQKIQNKELEMTPELAKQIYDELIQEAAREKPTKYNYSYYGD